MTKFKSLPKKEQPEFPIELLIKAFDFLAAHGDHVSLTRFLQFLYNHFIRFSDAENHVLMTHLVDNHCVWLFFHWATSVRQSFHHLLFYRMLFRDKHGKKKQSWRRQLQKVNAVLSFVLPFYCDYRTKLQDWRGTSKVAKRRSNPDLIRRTVVQTLVVPEKYRKVNFFDFKTVEEMYKCIQTGICSQKGETEASAAPIVAPENGKFPLATPTDWPAEWLKNDGYLDADLNVPVPRELISDILKHLEVAFFDYREVFKGFLNEINSANCDENRDFPVLKAKIPTDKID